MTRVLIVSWEYPPLIIGGIANHVHDLAGALARRGVEVSVVTAATDATPAYEERAFALFEENLRRYLVGEPLINVVDKHLAYSPRGVGARP